MSKFKIGDQVVIKKTGKIGVVKGREIMSLSDNKVKIEYIVKLDNGFNNWSSFNRNEIKKVIEDKKGTPCHVKCVDAPNGWKIILVGIIKREKQTYWDFDEINGVTCQHLRNGKDFRIGYAIYNPNDEWNLETGVKIAKNRAKTKPFCHMNSDFSGEFNKETIEALLTVKGEYILNNFDKFVTVSK